MQIGGEMASRKTEDSSLRVSLAGAETLLSQQQQLAVLRFEATCGESSSREWEGMREDKQKVSPNVHSPPLKASSPSQALIPLSSVRKEACRPSLHEMPYKEARSSRRMKMVDSADARHASREDDLQVHKSAKSAAVMSQPYAGSLDGYYISPRKHREKASLEEEEPSVLRRSRMELTEMQLTCRGLKRRSQKKSADCFEAEHEALCEKGCCERGKTIRKSEGSSRRTRTRKSTRRATREGSEPPQEAQIQQRSQQQLLRQKRKTPEAYPLALSLLPEASCVQKSVCLERNAQTVNLKAETSIRNEDLQFLAESFIRNDDLQSLASIIMWQDVPRSTLIFGLGCFFFSSASFLPVTHPSIISMLAYASLLHLAAVFFQQNFAICKVSESACFNPSAWELREADILTIVKLFLPTLNLTIRKYAQYFHGEPATTLRVVLVVWLLAQIGSFVSLWTFARLAFIALFCIPKCYSVFAEQLLGHGQALTERLLILSNNCSHKKAIAVVAFLMAWKLSTAFTRICGVFISIVVLRLYQQSYKFEVLYENNGLELCDSFDIPEQVKYTSPRNSRSTAVKHTV